MRVRLNDAALWRMIKDGQLGSLHVVFPETAPAGAVNAATRNMGVLD